jgi:hypothetical protein
MKYQKVILLLFVVLSALSLSAQVSPIMGIGSVQAFDNNGQLCTACTLYSYQAGTTTQQATFTDSTGATQNPNPIPFGSGARVNIWLTTAQFYKLVLCAENDGPTCAPADVLFSVDNVPGGATGSSSGGGAPFITNSANPATTGILRLAAADTICWRNVANSANLCFRKDTNDLLSWDGGSFKLPEVTAPGSITGYDIIWADNSAHRLRQFANGSSIAGNLVVSQNDISPNTQCPGSADAVCDWHFGTTQTPLCTTAPTANQYLYWNATCIGGAPGTPLASNLPTIDVTGNSTNIAATTILTTSAAGFYEAQCYLVLTRAATTSSTLPNCVVGYTDADTTTVQTIALSATVSGNTVGFTRSFATPQAFYAASGTIIQYSTTGYLSSGATSMQYSIHFRLIGPF